MPRNDSPACRVPVGLHPCFKGDRCFVRAGIGCRPIVAKGRSVEIMLSRGGNLRSIGLHFSAQNRAAHDIVYYHNSTKSSCCCEATIMWEHIRHSRATALFLQTRLLAYQDNPRRIEVWVV